LALQSFFFFFAKNEVKFSEIPRDFDTGWLKLKYLDAWLVWYVWLELMKLNLWVGYYAPFLYVRSPPF